MKIVQKRIVSVITTLTLLLAMFYGLFFFQTSNIITSFAASALYDAGTVININGIPFVALNQSIADDKGNLYQKFAFSSGKKSTDAALKSQVGAFKSGNAVYNTLSSSNLFNNIPNVIWSNIDAGYMNDKFAIASSSDIQSVGISSYTVIKNHFGFTETEIRCISSNIKLNGQDSIPASLNSDGSLRIIGTSEDNELPYLLVCFIYLQNMTVEGDVATLNGAITSTTISTGESDVISDIPDPGFESTYYFTGEKLEVGKVISNNNGTAYYSLDGENYTTSPIKISEAGDYNVYWYIPAHSYNGRNYGDQGKPESPCVYKIHIIDDHQTPIHSNIEKEFTGSSIEFTPTTTNNCPAGDIFYSTDKVTYSHTVLSYTDVGTYTVYYYCPTWIKEEDGKRTRYLALGSPDDPCIMTCIIKNKDQGDPSGVAGQTFVYDGMIHKYEVTPGEGGGDVTYSVNGGEYTTDVPSLSQAGNYDIAYKIEGQSGYSDYTGTFTVTILKRNQALPGNAEDVTFDYDGVQHSFAVEPGTGGGTVYYSVNGGESTTTVPSFSKWGIYVINYTIKGESSSWSDLSGMFTVTINEVHRGLPEGADKFPAGTVLYAKQMPIVASDKTYTVDGTLYQCFAVMPGDKISRYAVDSKISRFSDGNTIYDRLLDYDLVTKAIAVNRTDVSSWYITSDGKFGIGTIEETQSLTYPAYSEVLKYNNIASNTKFWGVGEATYSWWSGSGNNINTVILKSSGGSEIGSPWSGSFPYWVTFYMDPKKIDIDDNNNILVVEKEESKDYVTEDPNYKMSNLTYNGKAQTLGGVKLSSNLLVPQYSLTKGSGYSTKVPTQTNAGTYTVYWWAPSVDYQGIHAKGYATAAEPFKYEITINKAQQGNPTGAVSSTFTYDGRSRTYRVTPGKGGGTVTYSINGGAATTTPPTITDVGLYTIGYVIKAESNNYYDRDTRYFTVEVVKQTTSGNAEGATDQTIFYDGQAHSFPISTTAGSVKYSVNGGTATGTIPSFTNVGHYVISYTITSNNSNVSDSSGEYTIDIVKAYQGDPTGTSSDSFIYDGNTHVYKVTPGKFGSSVKYSVNGAAFTTTVPGFKNTGTYVVDYIVSPTDPSNYNDYKGQFTVIVMEPGGSLSQPVMAGQLYEMGGKKFMALTSGQGEIEFCATESIGQSVWNNITTYSSDQWTTPSIGFTGMPLLQYVNNNMKSGNAVYNALQSAGVIDYLITKTFVTNDQDGQGYGSLTGKFSVPSYTELSKVSSSVRSQIFNKNFWWTRSHKYGGMGTQNKANDTFTPGGSSFYTHAWFVNNTNGELDYGITSGTGMTTCSYDIIPCFYLDISKIIIMDNKVTKIDTSACEVTATPTSYVYDGTEKKPVVTVRAGDVVFTQGRDYSVTYSNNIEAGTATAKVHSLKPYLTGADKTITYSIASTTQGNPIEPSILKYTYDGKPHSFTVTPGNKGMTVTYKVDGSPVTPTFTNAGTYVVDYTIKGQSTSVADYSGSFTAVIEQADPVLKVEKVSDLAYTADLQSLGTATSEHGTVKCEVSGGEYELKDGMPFARDLAQYTVKFSVSGDPNYYDKSEEYIVTMSPKELAPVIRLF